MYKLKNKTNDPRRFRNKHSGCYVVVNPKKTILTNNPPKENDVWKVTLESKTSKKCTKKTKENKEDNLEKMEENEELNYEED